MIKRIILFTSIILIALSTYGINDYATLEKKAQRFYANQEWNSTSAMYELMLAQRPKELDVYVHAIVVAGIRKMPNDEIEFMNRTELYGLPLDSVFSGVRRISLSLAKPEVYIDFLELVKTKQPWLTRNINMQLLDFYLFRSDADGIINMASTLLNGSPTDINFLAAMGKAYALKGDFVASIDWYKKVLVIEPENYNAILILGNYYYNTASQQLKALNMTFPTDKKSLSSYSIGLTRSQILKIKPNVIESLQYLNNAYNIRNTPYLKKLITELSLFASIEKK